MAEKDQDRKETPRLEREAETPRTEAPRTTPRAERETPRANRRRRGADVAGADSPAFQRAHRFQEASRHGATKQDQNVAEAEGRLNDTAEVVAREMAGVDPFSTPREAQSDTSMGDSIAEQAIREYGEGRGTLASPKAERRGRSARPTPGVLVGQTPETLWSSVQEGVADPDTKFAADAGTPVGPRGGVTWDENG